MREGKIFTGILLTALCISLSAAAGNGFKLVKKDEVIALYERWISSGDDVPVREIQAVFYVRSDVASVIRLLQHAALGLEWNMNTNRYEVQAGKDGSWITYIRYDLPWPMDDQDCCLGFRVQTVAAGRKTIISFADNGGVGCPVEKGVSRITGTRGQWLIEPTVAGDLKMIYTITSDRSSTIPRWISDPLIHKNIFRTLTGFKQILESDKL